MGHHSVATRDSTQRFVLLNGNLSLVCGTGLISNPQATVTWTAPDGTTVMKNARFSIENGPEVVRLNFTRVLMSDMGVWRCNVTVESQRHIHSGGSLATSIRSGRNRLNHCEYSTDIVIGKLTFNNLAPLHRALQS